MTQETRHRILDAALPLFVEKGVSGTRTEEICKGAGVSNGSLFHFFPNKEALAAALYVEAIASYQSALMHILNGGQPTGETVRALVLAHWRWVAAEEASARFLFAQGGPGWHPVAAQETKAHNADALAAFAAWRAEPAQRRALRDLPEDAFLPVLFGPSMMATRRWLREPAASPPPTKLADDFAEAAERSLMKETTP